MTLRTADLENALVEGIADGVPLRQLCRIHGVGKSTVYDWMEQDAAFAGRIAGARAKGFDAIAEEALEIADDGTNDWETREREDGSEYEALNHEHVQRSKLRVETRLKLLAKWDPKRYGDAMQLKHADADGNRLDLADIIAARRAKVAGGDET
ncbi:terminase small subunit protein [Sphingomonas sp. DG1-23]|uniref:terminase small subunit-like protein n=1 Tax=Sphingomonas sp. DG1-23 TaxID=3068316 RepID=UPI00273F1262|nr:terminase small subunit protein [Sphingomonas sp. DG1-23]MDP5279920.1 terminase small subunit protein [Sphingomonas sp. DG1-23]